MSVIKAAQIPEGVVEATEDQWVEAWQFLVNTGIAWQLQGWFGRTAAELIESGIISCGEVAE